MQNNYYFLQHLVNELNEKLVGFRLQEIFSQEKDELILGFSEPTTNEEFYVRATHFPRFMGLYFTADFRRAKRNSVSLFAELTDAQVIGVQLYENERAFSLEFDSGYHLIFKLFGGRSNIMLAKDDKIMSLFHQKLEHDFELFPSALHRVLSQNFAAFEAAEGEIYAVFPTFGKQVVSYLETQFIEQKASFLPQKWQIIEQTLQKFKEKKFYITTLNDEIILSLLPIGDIRAEWETAMQASNDFYIISSKEVVLGNEKKNLERQFLREKKQTEAYLDAQYKRLELLEKQVKNEEIGHIIMANLYQIPARSKSIELLNFYTNEPLLVQLKEDYSAQKNAEIYYRKSKNEQIEIDKIYENIALRETKLFDIEQQLADIELIESMKDWKQFLKENTVAPKGKKVEHPAEQFKKFEVDGFEIWVGRNSKNNDVLTQQFAYKDDLWLHARDSPGSHVIVKFKAGKPFTKNVKEAAASIAAWFSKRKNEKVVPVILTQKKYVRKPKGFPDGRVKIEKEEVVMVEPQLPK